MTGNLAVVVLAGGEGRRIGGNKPLLMLGGERLIDRALRQARTWSEIIAVAVRDPQQVQFVDAPTIIDEQSVAGPLAGLISALRFGGECGCEFVLTTAADMPFLPQDLPYRLMAAIGRACCVVASSGGHLQPVCAVWRTCALDRLGSYLAGDRRSLKSFATFVGCREVGWAVGTVDPFFNINTADDLVAAEQCAGR